MAMPGSIMATLIYDAGQLTGALAAWDYTDFFTVLILAAFCFCMVGIPILIVGTIAWAIIFGRPCPSCRKFAMKRTQKASHATGFTKFECQKCGHVDWRGRSGSGGSGGDPGVTPPDP